jgi:electron transport complex protein RnfA
MTHLETLLLIALSAAVVNNFVLYYFVGLCSYIGVSRRLDVSLGMGMAVVFVMSITSLLAWTVTWFVLREGAPLTAWVWGLVSPGSTRVVDLSILTYIVYIFLIAASVQLVEMYVRRFFPKLYRDFGVYLPLITVNCAILWACLEIGKRVSTGDRPWTLDQALVYAVFGGVGFALAITIMAGIREEVQHNDIPQALRGPGLTFIAAGILAMAFSGFTGVNAALEKVFAAQDPPPATQHPK